MATGKITAFTIQQRRLLLSALDDSSVSFDAVSTQSSEDVEDLVKQGLVHILSTRGPSPFHDYFRLTREGRQVARQLRTK